MSTHHSALHATIDHWLTLPRAELDEIYRQATPGALPSGDMHGTVILAGFRFAKVVARLVRLLAWRGKVFDSFAHKGEAGVLVNRITPFSLHGVVAKVYHGTSWLDGKDTIVIDYSRTSFIARLIRDEIRQIEPGLYLGKVWWRRTRILDFALSAPDGAGGAGDGG